LASSRSSLNSESETREKMIKKTVNYKDFDSKPHSQDLYFHLKVDTITDNLHLGDRLEALQDMVSGAERELLTSEKQEILDVVKMFINLSYGKRVTVDGEAKFRQRPEILEDFRDSAAYDAFLWALFQDPEGAMSFLNDVMPPNLIEEARKAEAANGPKQPQDFQSKQVSAPTVSESKSVVDVTPEDEETPEQKRERLQRELADLG